MFLKLHDKTHDREEDYEVTIQSYRKMWETVGEVITRHHYEWNGFIVPDVNRGKRIVTIRWVGNQKQVSDSFIEVHECEDYLLDAFERNIRHHEERRRNRDEFEEHA